jgi:hypothetical protein
MGRLLRPIIALIRSSLPPWKGPMMALTKPTHGGKRAGAGRKKHPLRPHEKPRSFWILATEKEYNAMLKLSPAQRRDALLRACTEEK